MLHGTTIIPSVMKDPDDSDAETSLGEYVWSANDSRYRGVLSGAGSSYLRVEAPHVDMIRWVSTFKRRSHWRRLTARGAPVAPVTATTMRFRL